MRFDVYGRFRIDVVREHGRWVAYRVGDGLRTPRHDIVIPAQVTEAELETYLNDLLHEFAEPGRTLRRLD
jgi:hypothetical protein